ncbi:MAG TPA: LysM peptidoglycan-binding domain-containing protein [Candidatus Pacearchaeota archaeon]|nr:LysM peptidoglycan-binding domain-containing protein [Candidatus Pacearchaeota archaeon]
MNICTISKTESSEGSKGCKPVRKGRFKRLLLREAVVLVWLFLMFFVLPEQIVLAETGSVKMSLSNIEVAQQTKTNLEKNSSAIQSLEEHFLSNQEEGIVITPNTPVIKNLIQDQELLKKENKEQGQEQEQRKESVEYTIKEGDTISGIAASFGLKTQTILWANNLNDSSIIRPGDSITIPPADGIIYTVKKGDTLGKIAQDYKSDLNEILDWNQLDNDKIVEGQKLFLPGAKKPVIVVKTSPVSSSSSPVASNVVPRTAPVYSSCHQFPYGYCTWYVAQKRCVPWGGNAKDWPSNAQAYGYSVCWGSNCDCPAGSILVTRESWYGHVSYVIGQTNTTITISEMNRYGWAKVNTRTINKGNWIIRACIY